MFRTGLHISGAGGSGVLITRQPDGTFGPPSGILLHTLGIGVLIGIDIYDTVLILRTQEAVNAFSHPKLSIGAELSLAAGPLGSGGGADIGLTDRAPAWVYTKSKGFYAGIALDGTVVVERKDENERFYGRKVKAKEIIAGLVGRPRSVDGLIGAIEAAEGSMGGVPGGSRPSSAQGWAAGASTQPHDSTGWNEYLYPEHPIASSSQLSTPPPFRMPPALPTRRPSPQQVQDTGKASPLPNSGTTYPDDPPAYFPNDSDADITIGDKRTTEKDPQQ